MCVSMIDDYYFMQNRDRRLLKPSKKIFDTYSFCLGDLDKLEILRHYCEAGWQRRTRPRLMLEIEISVFSLELSIIPDQCVLVVTTLPLHHPALATSFVID